MNAYHRELRKKWKRADQKRKTAENKAVREVAARLLGHTDLSEWLKSNRPIWIDEEGNYVR
jgi:hypothetical protein